MRCPQYIITSISTLLVALSGKSGTAFTINPQQPGANENYDPAVFYVLFNGIGRTWLDTYLTEYPDTGKDISGGVTQLERGGTEGLMNLLGSFEGQNWTFNPAPRDLNGSFEIVH